MSRYIKADDLIDELHKQFPNDGFYNDKYWDSNRVLRAIGDTPTADVRENVRGKWVYDEEQSKDHVEKIYICSNCHNYSAWGETERIAFNFCPNCGATMWKGEEE